MSDNKKEYLLSLIGQIKAHPEPPFRADDSYWTRDPWPKFGGVSSGIVQEWCWFADYVIMQRATARDALKAIAEFEAEENMY